MSRVKRTFKLKTLWMVTILGTDQAKLFEDREQASKYAKLTGGILWKGRPEWRMVQR